MILRVFVASAASLLLAPAPAHSLPPGWFDFGPSATTVHFGSSASASCTASASSAEYTGLINVYEQAIAEATAVSCDSDFDGNIEDLAEVLGPFAIAWASTTAEAQVACTSSSSDGGSATACGWAQSSAEAFESALASVTASATARAFNESCDCQSTEAWSFGDAALVTDLYAEAFSTATAAACAVGNMESAASAYAECYQEVIAEVFATAIAQATLEQGCNSNEARTRIESRVSTDVSYYQECTFEREAVGFAEGTPDGGTDAEVTDVTDSAAPSETSDAE